MYKNKSQEYQELADGFPTWAKSHNIFGDGSADSSKI